MKLFDLIIKANTLVIACAAVVGIMGSPSFFQDSQVGATVSKEQRDADGDDAVVAGAFTETQPTITPSPTPTPTPIPVTQPVRIEIPSLGVDTDVTHVGVTADNVMEVPEDFGQVGWFDQSLKPGEAGSHAAIMSGHFDRTDGSPAVFHILETIENGDEIIVTAEDGIKYVFAATDVFSHPLEEFPVDIVYGETVGTSLKLITCDGVWHAGQQSYSDRLVVTTQLVRIEQPPDGAEAT